MLDGGYAPGGLGLGRLYLRNTAMSELVLSVLDVFGVGILCLE